MRHLINAPLEFLKDLINAPLEFLNDFHGGKSSKRFWGNRLLTIGVVLALGLYIAEILAPIIFGKTVPLATYNDCKDIIDLFFMSGFGLLFSGLAERLKIMNKK